MPWRFRRPELHPLAWLARIVPTRRSLAIGFVIVAISVFAYVLARETAVFAIDRIDVRGGSARVDATVRQALVSFAGEPLVGLDGSAVAARAEALPTVVQASYDRAFPHTLRVTIVPERPAAVLRSGAAGWLISIRGRVMRRLSAQADPAMPRVWVSGHPMLRVGGILGSRQARVAVRAAGLAGTFAPHVATVSYTARALVFHLRSGVALLLGASSDVKLKVAVAERALAVMPSGSTFLDVSVPGRAVSGIATPIVNTPASSSRG